ncbi:hypothetical protein HHI36_021139 [Cryptolaemus montrouzieri]|uniref:Uncharacterized protein n=1 Tax=Cryptolaemus montrouzieri TaxID=559131 RepID=A0ABD2MWS0_9CUCU
MVMQNYIDMSEKENVINPGDYEYSESVRRTKKNYTTKIHVLEKPSQEINFHLEGPSILKKIKSGVITFTRPKTVPPNLNRRVSLCRGENNGAEVTDIPMTSRELDNRSSHTNLTKLYQTSREPHPPLTYKEVEDIQKSGSKHDETMSVHINKMKDGIQRLQEITQKFNCTENYKKISITL